VTAPVSWREDALCRGTDQPELWSSLRRADQYHAAEVCALCPVRDACLAFAVSWRSYAVGPDRPYGVWGGWLFPDCQSGAVPHPIIRPPRPAKRARVGV